MTTTPPPANADDMLTAVDLIRRAGELTLGWFRTADLEVYAKGDGTPVTEADQAAERLIRTELLARFPHDTIIGEEEDDHQGDSARVWIVDPIDGTKAFTRGVPVYSNLMAMNDEHGPAIGVINLPAIGITVWAGRGLGCFENGLPAHGSTTPSTEAAWLTTSGLATWSDQRILAVRAAGMELRTWGDGFGFAQVATGRLDAMVDPEVSVWDVAPLPVILAEAGGRFSDLDGNDRIDGGSAVATNGRLHDDLLAILGS